MAEIESEQPETPAPKASDLSETFPSLAQLSDNELTVLLYTFGQLNREAKKYGLPNVIDFAGRWLVLLACLVVDAGYKNADELVASLAARSKRGPGVN
jgi:hypothetical protein